MRPRDILERLGNLTRRSKSERLEYEPVPEGLIAPLRYLPNQTRSQESWTSETGVYGKGGKIIQNSLLFRNDKWLGFAGQFKAIEKRPDSVIYLGPLFEHFGHFMLEGLARLWCADQFPGHSLVWSVPQGATSTKLHTWQSDWLAVLGVNRDVILVNEPTQFAEVIVPNVGFKIQSHFHPEYAAFLDRACPQFAPVSGTKIWLSRSRLEGKSGLLGSHLLEARLEQSGWTIIYPETLTVAEQLQIVSRAERVAGEVGSALHLPMFVAKANGLQLDVFPRRRFARTVRNSFALIADRKGFKQTIHDLGHERILQESEAHVTRIGQNFAPYLSALNIPMPPSAPYRGPSPAAAALNAMVGDVIGGTRYLQIGWAEDGRFFDVGAQSSDLVSETRAIDPRNLDNTSSRYFEMCVNDFFANFEAEQPKYDVIHIVKSPHLEILKQSMDLGHSNTIWVLGDDLQPSDKQLLENNFPIMTVDQDAQGFGAVLRRSKAKT